MLIAESKIRHIIRQFIKEEHKIEDVDVEDAFYDLASVVQDDPDDVNFNSALNAANFLKSSMTQQEYDQIVNFITSMENGKEISENEYDSFINVLNTLNANLMGTEYTEPDQSPVY